MSYLGEVAAALGCGQITKTAGNRSYYITALRDHLNSLASGGKLWDTSKGVLDNLTNHLSTIRARGHNYYTGAEALRRLDFARQRFNYRKLLNDMERRYRSYAGTVHPQAAYHKSLQQAVHNMGRGMGADLAMHDTLQYLRTGKRPLLNHPVDIALEEGRLPIGSMLFGS